MWGGGKRKTQKAAWVGWQNYRTPRLARAGMCKGLVCLADPGGELLRGAPAGGPVYSRRPGRPGLWTAGGRQERDVAGGRGRGWGGQARPQVKCTYTNRIPDAPDPEHLTVSICASRRDPALPAAGVHRHPVITRGVVGEG